MDMSQVLQPRASSTWSSVRLGSAKRRLRPLTNIHNSTSWDSATRPVPSSATLAGMRNRPPNKATQHSSTTIE
ncbi:hypothetical protein D9M68_777490 [compost metagenome]